MKELLVPSQETAGGYRRQEQAVGGEGKDIQSEGKVWANEKDTKEK